MPHIKLSCRARSQGGFGLVETMIGTVVLAVALLGHVASTVAEDAMARDGQIRSEALHTVRQLVERMRADDEWANLFTTLQQRQTEAVAGTVKAGPNFAASRLDDGRWAFDPRDYYPDFVLPGRVQSLRVLVEVPVGVDGLREDVVEPAFGLPADLNGDGVIDDQPHDGDYRVLPVRLRVIWTADGLGSRNFQLTTWLGVTR